MARPSATSAASGLGKVAEASCSLARPMGTWETQSDLSKTERTPVPRRLGRRVAKTKAQRGKDTSGGSHRPLLARLEGSQASCFLN